MFSFLYTNFKKGIQKIKDNPELIYTLVIAILITGAFLFTTERFTKIARDSQERLINVRIGSLQDAFVSFAGDKINDTPYLNNKITEIVKSNETIKSFRVIVRESDSYKIIASNLKDEIDTITDDSPFLITLATSDPNNSITTELKDSNERLFDTARAIKDNQGNVLGVVTTIQSLSQADLAIEKNIISSEIILIVIIILILLLFFRHSRIIDYMTLYKKLKEVDTLKDDFISMASHELRTPLTVIRGYADIMNGAPELSNETKEYVKKIDISAKDLDMLVGDILDVSRIQQGRMSFEYTTINPQNVISEVVSSLEIPAKEKGLNISFDKTEVNENQLINVDVNRFKQILINIIGNAVKYTNKGEVGVKQYTEGNRIYIRVSDSGIGMTEEERARLFEKFYRIKNKETENIRGTGLGLWITAQMVKQMSGTLSVESIKGVGSHFIISFPIKNK